MRSVFRWIINGVIYLILLLIVLFQLAPAWFFDDDPVKKTIEIKDGYYMLFVEENSNEELQIGFSTDQMSFHILADHCLEIFVNKDTILYSTVFSPRNDTSYYKIKTRPIKDEGLGNTPMKIKQNDFEDKKVNYEKVY